MQASSHMKVGDLLHPASLTGRQILVISLCALCVLIDGADFQVIGFLAPSIIKDLQIPPEKMGYVFAGGIFGMMLGSILLAPLADRHGRRPLLIGSMLLVAIAMMITATATNVWQLVALRFVAGFGLGSIMPIAISLAGEYSPSTRRVQLVIAVSACFTLGAVLGGVLAALLVPRFGWQSVFAVGGAVPALVALALFFLLPESLELLAVKGRHGEVGRIMGLLGQAQAIPPGTVFVPDQSPEVPSFRRLLDAGRLRTTLLIWALNALNLLMLMFLASWLPTLVTALGRSPTEAILVGTILQLGGAVGALVMGRTIQRIGFHRVMATSFFVSAIALVAVGMPQLPVSMLFALVAVCGFTVVGNQQALNGMSASYYPAHLRSTGIGWALSVGRFASLAGPIIAGVLIGANVGYGSLLQLAAIPAILSAVLIILSSAGGRTIGTAPTGSAAKFARE